MLWDNDVLAEVGDPINELPAARPTPSESSATNQMIVLRTLAQHAGSARGLGHATGLGEFQVRAAINVLRNEHGWPIENDGHGEFYLDRSYPAVNTVLYECGVISAPETT